jgi:ABC-type uncharacterized transport system substrate-binding protein
MMRRDWVKFYCMICMALAAASTPAFAHPHVWVTVNAEILYDEQKDIYGFRHKWTFDEYYSSFAVQGLDKNSDGKYDREELQELAQINVSTLKEFGYFTFPKLSGKLQEASSPKDYWLEYDGTRLTLFLTLPLIHPISSANTKDLALGIYDPTFYVDFALADETPIRLAGAPDGCKPVVTDPQGEQSGVASLGETFFNNLDVNSTEAESYAKKITISCPAS